MIANGLDPDALGAPDICPEDQVGVLNEQVVDQGGSGSGFMDMDMDVTVTVNSKKRMPSGSLEGKEYQSCSDDSYDDAIDGLKKKRERLIGVFIN